MKLEIIDLNTKKELQTYKITRGVSIPNVEDLIIVDGLIYEVKFRYFDFDNNMILLKVKM